MVLGITLAMMEERGKPLLDFFTCLSEAMMKITTWVIYLAPIGVFFLISGQVTHSVAMVGCSFMTCHSMVSPTVMGVTPSPHFAF